MTVRAKFVISKLERHLSQIQNAEGKWVPGEMVSVYGQPVYGNGDPEHENTKFWKATPSGGLHLGTVNKAAADYFELGAEYYVDFTRA